MEYTNEYYRQAFKTAITDLHTLLESVDDPTFSTAPAPGKWCIGEIISHLNITAERYLKIMEAALNDDSLPKKNNSKPYTHPIHIRLFIKVVSPEYKRKTPTVESFEPVNIQQIQREQLVNDFEAYQNRFIALIEKADNKDLHLGKIKVRNPVVNFIKMSLSACFAINEAHQRRHFDQIKNILHSSK